MAGAGKKKKSIPVIDKEADFWSLFNEATREQQESFAEALAQSLEDKSFSDYLSEHQASPAPTKPKSLKHSQYPLPQKDLDLHGLTGPEAENKMEFFFLTAAREGLKTVRIITGRGLHSEGPAVLPVVAELKLTDLKARKLVRAFHWDKKTRERSGAIIVYIP